MVVGETRAPLPPVGLVRRTGVLDEADPLGRFEEMGRNFRRVLAELLPREWSWAGKRVLDFGCGIGRDLRAFLDLAGQAELHGCDLDEASIAWLDEHLSPPLQVFVSGEQPPLPRPDGFFDLIWAHSVFTHLSGNWADWLLELRRLLRPDGLLVASFLHEHAEQERIGMSVIHEGLDWDRGGPVVLHSPWWLREHWSRAFHIDRLDPYGFGRFPPGSGYELYGEPPLGQGAAVLRRPHTPPPTPDQLRHIDPDDPREHAALRHNLRSSTPSRSTTARSPSSTATSSLTTRRRSAGA